MPTLGDVRLIIATTPAAAGADDELLTQRVNARYFEILNHRPWTRLRGEGVIQTVAEYREGTVAVVKGSTALVGTGTTWTAAMTGRRIRVSGRNEWYTFTRATDTTGTLDRPYEGEDDATASYRIWQPIYSLPADADILDSITVPFGNDELDQIDPEELDQIDPARIGYGRPVAYANYTDDPTTKRARIELWPGVELAEGFPVRYRSTGTRFAVTDGAVLFPDWIDTDAIVAGVQADFWADQGAVAQAQLWEAAFRSKLQAMVNEDNQRMAPATIRLADRYTDHRVDRAFDQHGRRWAQLRNSVGTTIP